MSAQVKKTDDVGLGKAKEQESITSLRKEEDKMMAEITSAAQTIDREDLSRARESLETIKHPIPEPTLSPDVEDAGVYSPQAAAEDVVTNGPTIQVGVAESVYKKGIHTKVMGAVKDKVVVGVSSLAALAMWVGRLVKKAHKHTMKVVFRSAN